MIQIKSLPASDNNVLAIKCSNCGKSVLRVSSNIFNMSYTLWYGCPLCDNQMKVSGYDIEDIAVPSNEIPPEYIGKRKNTNKKVRIDFSNFTNIFTPTQIAEANKENYSSVVKAIAELSRTIQIASDAWILQGGWYLYSRDKQWLTQEILKTLKKENKKENIDWVWMPNNLSLDGYSSFISWLVQHKDNLIILVDADTNIMVDTNAVGVLGRKDFYGDWKSLLNSGRQYDEREIRVDEYTDIWGEIPREVHTFTSNFIFISDENGSEKGIVGGERYSSLYDRLKYTSSYNFSNGEVVSFIANEIAQKGYKKYKFITEADISKLLTAFLYVSNYLSNHNLEYSDKITFSVFDKLLENLNAYKKDGKSFNDFFKACFCKDLSIIAVKYSL